MFKEQLKTQYWWYFAAGLFMATWNIIRGGFREPIVIDILVNIVLVALLSFIAFCVIYCVSWIAKKIPLFKQGAKTLWVLLLITALSLLLVSENTDAANTHPADPYGDRFGYGAGGGGAGRGGAIGAGIGYAIGVEFENAYNNVRDAVVESIPGAAKKVWSWINPDNTPDCSSCKFGCSSCPPNGQYNGYSGAY